jgi:hypothetical protein
VRDKGALKQGAVGFSPFAATGRRPSKLLYTEASKRTIYFLEAAQFEPERPQGPASTRTVRAGLDFGIPTRFRGTYEDKRASPLGGFPGLAPDIPPAPRPMRMLAILCGKGVVESSPMRPEPLSNRPQPPLASSTSFTASNAPKCRAPCNYLGSWDRG